MESTDFVISFPNLKDEKLITTGNDAIQSMDSLSNGVVVASVPFDVRRNGENQIVFAVFTENELRVAEPRQTLEEASVDVRNRFRIDSTRIGIVVRRRNHRRAGDSGRQRVRQGDHGADERRGRAVVVVSHGRPIGRERQRRRNLRFALQKEIVRQRERVRDERRRRGK